MIQLAEFEETWHGFYQGIIYTPVLGVVHPRIDVNTHTQTVLPH